MQEAFLFLLFVFFVSGQNVQASEFRSTSQHSTINRLGQDKVSKQQDLFGKITLTRKLAVGFGGTYLERFNKMEKRGGVLVALKPTDSMSFELSYQKGNGNEILPVTETGLQSYIQWREGLTPFFLLKDTKYSVTHLRAVNLGMEVEKIPQWIVIPFVLFGKATFAEPATTRDILSYGLRVTYYTEMKYALSLFSSKGKEASQGILGRSTRVVDTLSGGVALSYYFIPDLKTELKFDHTDYDQLRTQFQTTMLTLTWML